MIPKTIHYCWFGRQPFPPLLTKCIESWKQHLPEYELVLWNEDRFDLSQSNLFVQQAYKSGKYAFVSDYVRMYALYHHGGIYLDTDVEVVKSFDDLLDCGVFFGFENQKMIASGLGCGAKPKHWFIQEIMNEYEQIEFIKKDGTFDLTPCPHRETTIALKHGLVLNNKTQRIIDMIFLSTAFLNPLYLERFDHVFSFDVTLIKSETYSIHHFANSWGVDRINYFFHRLKWVALKIEKYTNYQFALFYVKVVNITSGIFAIIRIRQ